MGTILVSTGTNAEYVKHVVGAQHLKQDNAKINADKNDNVVSFNRFAVAA